MFSVLFGSRKIKDLKNIADDALDRIDSFVYYFEVFLLLVATFIIIYSIIRLYFLYVDFRLKRIVTNLHRLFIETELLDNKNLHDQAKIKELNLSRTESLNYLTKIFTRRFIVSRIGLHTSQRVLDGLFLISENKIDKNLQISLIGNWISLVSTFLK